MKTLSALAALVGSAICAMAQTSYMPLAVGNRWVLETSGATRQTITIEVHESRVIQDKTYYLVSGYMLSDAWLRQAEDGSIYMLRKPRGEEKLVAHPTPGAPTYTLPFAGCQQTAKPAGQLATYRGPNYELANTLTIAYEGGGCADFGLTREVYAQGVGLVRRSVTTLLGEVTYDLVFAKVGGTAVLGKSKEIVLSYDFDRGSKGWLAGFTDYSLRTSDLQRVAELRKLPTEVSAKDRGFYLQGMNRSDDLFMFIKKQVSSTDGVEANQSYRVFFKMLLASNAQSGCAGIGGAPGESVYLKAGGSTEEPLAVVDGTGYVSLTLDKGQQANGGTQAGVVGNIANGAPCDANTVQYVTLEKEYAHPAAIKADPNGSFWLMTGTDSGYEGLTGLYIRSIVVRINPAVEPAAAR